MADRYWVGGVGTWNASSTTNWSTTSGGSGGASAPTVNDNVIFDTASGTGKITISSAVCLNMTVSASQALTFSGSITGCTGSITLPSGGSTVFTGCLITFTSTTTGKTITTNGKTVNRFTFNGTGGGWTFQDNVTLGGNLVLQKGTVNTNDKTLNASLIDITASGPTVNFGASVINLTSGIQNVGGYSWTLNAGTSNITITATSPTFSVGSSKTFYDLTFTNSTYCTISANTISFRNLTFTEPSSAIESVFILPNVGTFTVTGTLTASSTTANRRIFITNSLTNDSATTRTITANAVSLSNVDFYRIQGSGAASWTGTNIGNAGSNAGITFTTAKTVYWNLASGGNFMASTAWATSSGGTPSISNFPLPQDTAIIENTGLNSGTTITFDQDNPFPNINASTRTNGVTFDLSSSTTKYFTNNITFGSGITISGSGTVYVLKNCTIVSAGKQFNHTFNIYSGATLTLSDTFFTAGSLSSNAGTIVLNANASCSSISLDVTATLTANSNKIIVTGNNSTVVYLTNSITLTNNVVFELSYSGSTGTRTITGYPNSKISVNIIAGSDKVTFTGTVTPLNLNFTGFSGTFTNAGITIYGDLTLSPTMTLAAGGLSIDFSGSSVSQSITTNGKSLSSISLIGSNATYVLQDNLTLTSNCQFNSSTLNLNGKLLTASTFTTGTGATDKNLTFNGGVIDITGSYFEVSVGSSTFSTTGGTGTGKISMSSSSAKSFIGGGRTYNCTLENNGTGVLTISGSNTITTISNTTTGPRTFKFTSSTTQTITNFNISGIYGNQVTINSSSTTNHILSKASGVVSAAYCTISNSTATGGATWQSYTINGNIDGGSNTGWDFGASSGNGIFFGSNF